MHDRTWRRAGVLLVAFAALAAITSGCQSSKGPGAAPNASSASPGPGSSASGGGASVSFSGIGGSNPFASSVASPATSLGSHDPLSGPPADPFAGTPAARWANGAAGIVVPAAKAAGGFPAWRVAQAYEMTRKLLIAAALDKKTLLGGKPAAFEGLLTPQQRTEFVAGLARTRVDAKGHGPSRGWLVSFFPGSNQLIGSVIKVHGTMNAGSATENGVRVLRVTVDYIFVYAVQPPRQPEGWMRVVAQETGSVEFGNWAQGKTPFDPWVLFGPSVAGIDCTARDGYVHPAFPTGPPPTVQPSGQPVDPYAMSSAASGSGLACQPTTGT